MYTKSAVESQDAVEVEQEVYKERLLGLGLLSFKMKSLREDIITVFSYLMRGSPEGRPQGTPWEDGRKQAQYNVKNSSRY